jgi:hypothetical protein
MCSRDLADLKANDGFDSRTGRGDTGQNAVNHAVMGKADQHLVDVWPSPVVRLIGVIVVSDGHCPKWSR